VRNSFPYRDKLRQSWALGRNVLEIDLDDLMAFDAQLANQVQGFFFSFVFFCFFF
jgi:hypothetical protein